MRTLRTVAELRTALAPARRAGRTIGLVPTMGALHEGHLALLRRARAQCDVVVVSLFVNPAQFNESADLERYPRRERDDAGLAAEAGADLLFAPAVDEVYPPGFATAVEVLGLTDRLEGASRGASHFRGVTTVVTKLLCMASPDTLYLGQKDAQQVLVIRRLVADLNLPVAIEVQPTVREPDGLARSSRNALLGAPARTRARGLCAALRAAEERAATGERAPEKLLGAAARGARAVRRAPGVPGARRPRHAGGARRARPPGAAGDRRAGRRGAADRQRDPPTHRDNDEKGEHFDMQRVMLKSKIHRATVSDCDLHYVGSITIDPDLLEAADIFEHEQVHVVDVDNGARFETYTIAGERGSGAMKVNGAAARLVHRGDTIIVISYAHYDRSEMERYEPRVVHVEAQTNRIVTVDDAVATLLTEPREGYRVPA